MHNLKIRLASILCGVSFFIGATSLTAEDSEGIKAPAPIPAKSNVDECSKELLLTYFPEVFVDETLKKFNVAQDKWASIKKDVLNKDKEIIKTVEDKAAKLDPNPLKDPQQRQAAVKIFRETLLEVFSNALKANGITDDSQIQAMLDDIQQQKAKRFALCMEKQRNHPQNGNGNNAAPAPSHSKTQE
jgi:hypothetical protein